MSGTYVDSKVVEAAAKVLARKAYFLADLADNCSYTWPRSAWGGLKARLTEYAGHIENNPWSYGMGENPVGEMRVTMEIIAAENNSRNLTRMMREHGDDFVRLYEVFYDAVIDNSRCQHCGHIGGH